jgi:hypothetical protein
MSSPLLFIDTDLFVLMAGAGLLGHLAECLNIPPANIRRLPSLEYQIKSKKFIDKIPADELARLQAAITNVAPWTDSPADTALLERLQTISDIDDGEALLFATLHEHQVYLLASGDKRSMIALGKAPELNDVRESLRGRIISLESALTLLIRKLGASVIGPLLRPFRERHQTVSILFGYKTEFDDEESLRQIRSYLDDLKKSIGSDLLYYPD